MHSSHQHLLSLSPASFFCFLLRRSHPFAGICFILFSQLCILQMHVDGDFFFSLSGITIGHVALLLGRMMRQTMSLIGFWENDADVSTFWVRPVELSPLIRATLGVPAWAAKRKWNLLCIQHAFFYVYTAWFLTKKPTWPDVLTLKYNVLSETYCLPSCNRNGFEIEEHKC